MAEDYGPPMTIMMVVCTAACFLFMSLRFYCKHLMSTRLAWDDAVLVFSWVRIPFSSENCVRWANSDSFSCSSSLLSR